MNIFTSFTQGIFQSEGIRSATSFVVDVATRVWRAADLTSLVTFLTGIIVGLLIPSRHWPTIITVIIAGALLRAIIDKIDSRSLELERRKSHRLE